MPTPQTSTARVERLGATDPEWCLVREFTAVAAAKRSAKGYATRDPEAAYRVTDHDGRTILGISPKRP